MPTPATMTAVINEHLKYEADGDARGAVSMYTADVKHDVVGSPMGVLTGPDAAQGFYEHLISDLDLQHMEVAREWFGEDFAVMEHAVDANVTGSFMGIDGHGRAVHFRMLHVWEFRGDQICRENVWLDGGAIAAQLAG